MKLILIFVLLIGCSPTYGYEESADCINTPAARWIAEPEVEGFDRVYTLWCPKKKELKP